jgi:putative endonuclease
MAKHNEIGTIGEKVAEEFLIGKGHKILARNYRKSYGELDIVSEILGAVHFVEVKSVSHETPKAGNAGDHFRPEENVHPQKIKRLLRTIESYILEKGIEGEWQFDVVAVYLDEKTKTAKVRFLENIVLGS